MNLNFFTDNEVNVLVMEYLPSSSIYDNIKEFGAIPENIVKKYAIHILEGIDFLHMNGIIHCDIKCANILLTASDECKICD